MLNDKEVREMCRKLKPIIFENADKLWTMYLVEDKKGREDMALEIELIAEKYLKEKQILLEPPSLKDTAGLFWLGDVHYNNKKIYPLFLTPENFLKQIGIFSITGEGKTNTAMLLALQLLKFKIPFLVIDWKRAWRNLLSYKNRLPGLDTGLKNHFSVDDIQIFTIGRDVAPFDWNPFRAPPGSDAVTWINTIAEVLEKSHISGMGVGALVNRIYSKKFRELKITSDSTFFPNFYDGLRELESLYARERELKWKQTALRIFESFCLGPASKAFNSRTPVKLEKLLDKPVIFELDLEMPKHLRAFFAEIILRWIHLYRLKQGQTDRFSHALFLEEVHNLFPKTRIERETYSSLENIFREIRDFGESLISLDQHPSLLPIYILGNCHTQIYLGLQHEADIKAAKQALFLKNEEQEYLNMLNVGEAIVKVKNRVEPCLVKIPLVHIRKGETTDEWLKSQHFSGLSRPAEAEFGSFEHFSNRDNISEEKSVKSLKSVNNLLIDILQNPLSSLVRRYRRLGINMREGNEVRNELVSQGLAIPKRIITRATQLVLFEITARGKAVLRDLGCDVKDTIETMPHQFWKLKISQYYKNKGFEVLVEEHVNGRPDIIVMNGKKKIAVEIETGSSDFTYNIERDLKLFDEVICIATSKNVEEKIKNELRDKNLNGRLKITSVFAFDID